MQREAREAAGEGAWRRRGGAVVTALRWKTGDRVIVAIGNRGTEREVVGAGPAWVRVKGAGRFRQGDGYGEDTVGHGNGRLYDVAEWPRIKERAESDEQIAHLMRDSRWLTDDEAKRIADIVRDARARDLDARGVA